MLKRKRLERILQFSAFVAVYAILCYAEPEAPEPTPSENAKSETMFTLIVKGGPVMIPIGLASIVALALTVERFISLKRDNVIPPDFLEGLVKAWTSEGNDSKDAIKYCEDTSGAAGKIFKAAIMRIHKGEDAMEKAIEDAGYREADKLKRSLKTLAIIASTAPLMGLLGTVYGMIDAFQTATEKGMEAGGGPEQLAMGIYQALVTTAAGLTVAIPVLLLYQILSAKVDGLIDDLDEMGIEFMTSCIESAPTTQTIEQMASPAAQHTIEKLEAPTEAPQEVIEEILQEQTFELPSPEDEETIKQMEESNMIPPVDIPEL